MIAFVGGWSAFESVFSGSAKSCRVGAAERVGHVGARLAEATSNVESSGLA